MAARRNRDRDSGTGINNPGDETLDEIERLDVIEEDDLDNPEDSPLHTPPEELPAPVPAMAQAAPAPGVLPGQLTSLPLFDGDRGEAFVNWLEIIENAEQTYGWKDQNVMSVIRSKGGPKIAGWMRAQRFMNQEFTGWRDGNNPMRTQLFERLGPKYTASTAVLAVANLKEHNTESCADFMDRYALAVDKTYYAIRNGAGFPAVFAASILSHFRAGLKPEISKVVLSAATPPDTPAAMLAAAKTVEAELSKKTTPGASALAVTEEEAPEAVDKETKEKSELFMMEIIEDEEDLSSSTFVR